VTSEILGFDPHIPVKVRKMQTQLYIMNGLVNFYYSSYFFFPFEFENVRKFYIILGTLE
jgi:hypothetical protein